MKKSLFILVLLFVPIICSAQILEKSASGKYRISTGKTEKWESLNITVKPEAQKYDSYFTEAISSPNKKILVEKSEDFLKLKLLFKEKVEVKEIFIVYNSQTKIIDYLEVITEKEEATYLILFCFMSLILMAISNVLYKKRRIALIAAIAAAVTVFTPIIAIVLFFFPLIVASAVAFLVVAAVIEKDDKFYKILSIIFYIAMVVGMILLFI